MVYKPRRMRFGAFFAPFHSDRVNPTLVFERDLNLIKWMDDLTYDEAWIGEHHSGAYECIASPEVFIATAAERTKHIHFGTGVNSLSYHHPLILADRIAQLDHQIRGRLTFGVGPGQLIADAYMMGVDPADLRRRMNESLEVLVKLFNGETVTCETDWFTLREARMHILPYQNPLEIAVASAISPTGARAAGQCGGAMLSVAASHPAGFAALADHWQIYEQKAAEYNQNISRDSWRIVTPFHIAETKQQAEDDLRHGLLDMFNYFKKFGGDMMPTVNNFDQALEAWQGDGLGAFGVGMVGTSDDLIEHIKKLQDQSGGFGSFLSLAHNAADYTATKRCYELVARYVMPEFQSANNNRSASIDWASQNADRFMAEYTSGIDAAIKLHEDEKAKSA